MVWIVEMFKENDQRLNTGVREMKERRWKCFRGLLDPC